MIMKYGETGMQKQAWLKSFEYDLHFNLQDIHFLEGWSGSKVGIGGIETCSLWKTRQGSSK